MAERMTKGSSIVRVLYFTSPVEDYLGDALLHGLRTVLGADLVDYPKSEIMYKTCPDILRRQVRGRAFTLYQLLDDIEIDRGHVIDKLQAGHYDLIIFSDIWRQYGLFMQYRRWLRKKRTIVIDGADTPQVYPYAGLWLRDPSHWFLPRAHRHFPYYKREWTPETQFNVWSRALPGKLREWVGLRASASLKPIAFSIPEEKIVSTPPRKDKTFSTHIVDAEVASRLQRVTTSYAFETEDDYYRDLQRSKFGITTRRAGWDCLRHYEIAANGAVPCFRELDQKPASCAPHGLSRANSLIYRDANDLLSQVDALPESEYSRLQRGAIAWARENSTRARAVQLLASISQFGQECSRVAARDSDQSVTFLP